MILLDGSRGEGGGQVLRTALSLSLVTGQSFRISKIRANRSKPGLRPQHLKALNAAAAVGNASTTGGAIDSSRVTFIPAEFVPKDQSIEIGTAGSTGLVLQTIHLPLAMKADRPIQVELGGGTFNPKAPGYSYLETTWKSYLDAFGMLVSLKSPQAGFYPRGGGRIEARIAPSTPSAFRRLRRGPLTHIRVVAGLANLGEGIADRMLNRADARLEGLVLSTDCEISFEKVHWPSPGQGAVLTLCVEYEDTPAISTSFLGIGERGKPAERVADEAVDQFLAFESVENAAVDPHSADQILLPLALANGESAYTVSEVTEHLRTNVATIQAFLDRTILIEESSRPNQPSTVIIS